MRKAITFSRPSVPRYLLPSVSVQVDQAWVGVEEILTMNGKSHIALIGAYWMDSYERMDRERIHLLLIDDAKRGIEDIQAGRTFVADPAIAQIQQRRAASNSGKPGSRWRHGHQLSQGESTRGTHP